jgi:hypothetical protein
MRNLAPPICPCIANTTSRVSEGFTFASDSKFAILDGSAGAVPPPPTSNVASVNSGFVPIAPRLTASDFKANFPATLCWIITSTRSPGTSVSSSTGVGAASRFPSVAIR